MFEAVRCRITARKSPAAFLSGGLDSSALVAIAARCLQEKNQILAAFAAVVPDSSGTEFKDEREFIDEFAANPNVRIEYVAPEAGGPFDSIDDHSAFARGPFRTSRRYLNDALMERAAAAGADVILSGSGGEAGPTTWGQGYYLELAASSRWYTLARELRLRQMREKRSPVRLLGRELVNFLSPGHKFRPVFLISPDFPLTAENRAADRRFYWPDHRRAQEDHVRARLNGHGNSSPVGLPQVTQPFMDKRVLEFCLAMPGHMKVRDGYIRYAIRRALQGILPEKIQWRTDKMPFAPDYEKRYRAQLGKAREFVAGIRRKDPVRSIVDIHRLQYLLDHPDSPAGRAEALVRIPASIHLICFLRQFPEFQA